MALGLRPSELPDQVISGDIEVDTPRTANRDVEHGEMNKQAEFWLERKKCKISLIEHGLSAMFKRHL